MLQGHVRDDAPYVTLSLPGRGGSVLSVEFVVDTGFNGELALPGAVIGQLEASFLFEQDVLMADGTRRRRPHYELTLDWDGEPRLTEAMALEGNPLLGGAPLRGFLFQAEMIDGGEVVIESL